MKIDYIRDFDKTDSIQQMIVLHNASELLEYLKREHENLLSHFGMDNRTHEGVTERTDKHFPLGHCSQQKRVSRVNCTVLRLPLTLFFLWLLGN